MHQLIQNSVKSTKSRLIECAHYTQRSVQHGCQCSQWDMYWRLRIGLQPHSGEAPPQCANSDEDIRLYLSERILGKKPSLKFGIFTLLHLPVSALAFLALPPTSNEKKKGGFSVELKGGGGQCRVKRGFSVELKRGGGGVQCRVKKRGGVFSVKLESEKSKGACLFITCAPNLHFTPQTQPEEKLEGDLDFWTESLNAETDCHGNRWENLLACVSSWPHPSTLQNVLHLLARQFVSVCCYVLHLLARQFVWVCCYVLHLLARQFVSVCCYVLHLLARQFVSVCCYVLHLLARQFVSVCWRCKVCLTSENHHMHKHLVYDTPGRLWSRNRCSIHNNGIYPRSAGQ